MADSDSTTNPYGYIYLIRNLVNGKVYVGQTVCTIKERWKRHCRDSETLSLPLHRAIKKYGVDAFSVDALGSSQSQEDLDEQERSFVDAYGSTARDVGYNMMTGGKGHGKHSEESKAKMRDTFRVNGHPCAGKVMSAETKAKIGAKNAVIRLGTKLSEETKRRIGEAGHRQYESLTAEERAARGSKLKGIPRSPEVCIKIGLGNKGKTIPEEMRQRISKALTGKVIPPEVRQKISTTLRGRVLSEQSRRNISEANRIKVPWNKGKRKYPAISPLQLRMEF